MLTRSREPTTAEHAPPTSLSSHQTAEIGCLCPWCARLHASLRACVRARVFVCVWQHLRGGGHGPQGAAPLRPRLPRLPRLSTPPTCHLPAMEEEPVMEARGSLVCRWAATWAMTVSTVSIKASTTAES